MTKYGRFVAGLAEHGVRVIGRGIWYISSSHDEEHVQHAIEAARDVLQTMQR
jgi:hypothetical protein